ncbi:phosphoserine phosphatase SerB [Gryllotalpicola sp.]|uniref:phosphoserine phosphatase SerB n=1 Tax=Gryllotalpicola sp. TaxID=1932787 RepID=UPI0026228AF1|nr:phosphoserine phosphatase SerB [Gryllotalpicola sp.]
MSAFLVVLDADSTLLHDEVIELIAAEAGTEPLVASITARAMHGELDFVQSLRERVGTFAGLPESALVRVRARVTVTKGASELVTAVQAAGGAVGVVSGGFHEILDPIAAALGLDFLRANRLGVADGRLTGEVDGPIVDAVAKAASLVEWSERSGIPLSRTVAVGDGANDLQMMQEAALSVAFNAKPVVRERADVAVNRRDLSQVLPLLGLRG